MLSVRAATISAALAVTALAAACGGGASGGNTGNNGGSGTTSTGTSAGGNTTSSTTSGAGAGTTSSGGDTTSSSGTTSTGSTTSSTGSGTMSGNCPVFLPTSPWNTAIDNDPVDPLSDQYIASVGGGTHLHPDFGSTFGIPYQYVNNSVSKSPVIFDGAPDESDNGPYPIPANPVIEDGSDAHMLLVHTDECVLYEIDEAAHMSDGWHGYSGAIWDLKINSTRPLCWTSADAAGLPIFPGLARYEEAKSGVISHALRFTVQHSQQGFVAPASHYASSNTSAGVPPMGLRFRLKASYDISAATPQAKIVLTALKKYGMIVADNGSNWFISGAPDPGWDDNDLDYIKSVPGSAFEVVKSGPITTAAGCP